MHIALLQTSCSPVLQFCSFQTPNHGPGYYVLPRKQCTLFPQDLLFPCKCRARGTVQNCPLWGFIVPEILQSNPKRSFYISLFLSDAIALSPVWFMFNFQYSLNIFLPSPSHNTQRMTSTILQFQVQSLSIGNKMPFYRYKYICRDSERDLRVHLVQPCLDDSFPLGYSQLSVKVHSHSEHPWGCWLAELGILKSVSLIPQMSDYSQQ